MKRVQAEFFRLVAAGCLYNSWIDFSESNAAIVCQVHISVQLEHAIMS